MSRNFLKTPPPAVITLQDSQFFVRAVPVPDAQTRAEVTTQVELALENLAPFPLAQMYYGYHWLPGAKHALAYAAYRKRFATTSTETWPAADAVIPVFVTILNPAAKPATTYLLHAPDSVTAIHWTDASGVPTQVSTRLLPQVTPEAPPIPEADLAAARVTLRTELLRSLSGTTHLSEFDTTTVITPTRTNDGLAFVTSLAPASTTTSATTPPSAPQLPLTTICTREQLDALDIRDKTDLATLRSARRRNLLLWRIMVACFVILGLCALLEIAVFVGKGIQEKRNEQVRLQAPGVAEIERNNTLAVRIEDLSTKRLLPFEMIDLIRPSLPPSILFTRIITRNLNSFEIQGKTSIASDFNAFRTALNNQNNIQKAEVTNSGIRDGSTTFTIVVTFKPNTVIAAENIPPPKPPPPSVKPTDDTTAQQPSAASPAPGAPSASAPPSVHDQIQQQLTPAQQPASQPQADAINGLQQSPPPPPPEEPSAE